MTGQDYRGARRQNGILVYRPVRKLRAMMATAAPFVVSGTQELTLGTVAKVRNARWSIGTDASPGEMRPGERRPAAPGVLIRCGPGRPG